MGRRVARPRRVVLRPERTKDREKRIVPISNRLRQELEMRRNDPDGRPLPPAAHVFGDEIGRRVGSIRRAWQTAVLRAHGHKPVWIWKRKDGPKDKGSTSGARNQKRPIVPSICISTICGTKAARAYSKAVGRCITSSTCSAMRPFNRPAHTSTRRCEDSTNRCAAWRNRARLASPLQATPPAINGPLARKLPPPTGTH